MSSTPNSSILTTSNGNPIDDNQNSLTAGEYGPILLQDFALIDKLSHFDRERIPERVVHAQGAGAWGYFQVTDDLTKYCKSKFIDSVGKKTPIFVRFSTTLGQNGSGDSERDPRGFAIQFYTEQGNWDLVQNNTPFFFIRDPMKFPDIIHSRQRNPQTNLKDPNMSYDFLSNSPETTHNAMFLYSDRGTSDGYRHMDGFGTHTFKWVNSEGEQFWIKIHIKTDSGIKNMTAEKAIEIRGSDPDYHTRDLYNHLASGQSCSWTFYVQIMKEADGYNYKWNIFDPTKIWPHGDYPLIRLGKIVLNRNPENYFAETEQSAFSPSHLVPGIEPSADRILQARLFAYPDTQRYRLGANFLKIPVNCPFRTTVSNGQRDGFMVVNGNQGSQPNYEPNTFHQYQVSKNGAFSQFKVTGLVGRFKPAHPNDDFAQPSVFFRKVFNDQARTNLINNISNGMKTCRIDIRERMVRQFYKVDPEYGERAAKIVDVTHIKSHL